MTGVLGSGATMASIPVKRLMIVDDHHSVRRGVRGLVEATGYYSVVAEAADSRAAVDMSRNTRPDIAVIDDCLPGLSGVYLATELKRLSPRIAILMYTAHEREDFVLEALDAGVRGLVLKSEPGTQVLRALDSLSSGRPFFSSSVSERLLDSYLKKGSRPLTGFLTNREREVVQRIAEGQTRAEMATGLRISVKTVETHRTNVMQKLCLRTTADLVRYAVRNGIIVA